MDNRIDAIYARQPVDKKDSVSIESQIAFCKYKLKGGNCKETTGSGKIVYKTGRNYQTLLNDKYVPMRYDYLK